MDFLRSPPEEDEEGKRELFLGGWEVVGMDLCGIGGGCCCCGGGGCDDCNLAVGECLGASLKIWYSDGFFSGEGDEREMPEVGEVLIPESWKAVLEPGVETLIALGATGCGFLLP